MTFRLLFADLFLWKTGTGEASIRRRRTFASSLYYLSNPSKCKEVKLGIQDYPADLSFRSIPWFSTDNSIPQTPGKMQAVSHSIFEDDSVMIFCPISYLLLLLFIYLFCSPPKDKVYNYGQTHVMTQINYL